MRVKISDFKLGLFIIAGTTLLVSLVVMFGAGVFTPRGIVLETCFDRSVDGLDVGSPLKYRGVRIGSVREIGLVGRHYKVTDTQWGRRVLIRMELDPPQPHERSVDRKALIESWLKEGLRVRLASQGLTGVGFMEADFVSPEDDPPMKIGWEPEELYVPAARTQFARVVDTIEGIGKDLKAANIPKIASNLEKLLATTDRAVKDADLKQIGTQVRDALARIEKVAANVDRITSDPHVQDASAKAVGTLDDLKGAIGDVRTRVAELGGKLNTVLDETKGAVASAHKFLDGEEVAKAVERIGQVSERLDSTLARIEASLARKDEQVGQILGDLKAVSANMRDLSHLISRYPALVPFGEPPTPSKAYEHE